MTEDPYYTFSRWIKTADGRDLAANDIADELNHLRDALKAIERLATEWPQEYENNAAFHAAAYIAHEVLKG